MVVVSSTVFNILSITPQASAILLSWVMPLGFTGVVQGTAGAGNGSYSSNFTDVSSPFYAPGNGCHDQHLPRFRRPDQFAVVVLPDTLGAVGDLGHEDGPQICVGEFALCFLRRSIGGLIPFAPWYERHHRNGQV